MRALCGIKRSVTAGAKPTSITFDRVMPWIATAPPTARKVGLPRSDGHDTESVKETTNRSPDKGRMVQYLVFPVAYPEAPLPRWRHREFEGLNRITEQE